jgi:hypothetical protein
MEEHYMTIDDIIRMAKEVGGDDWGIFRDFMPEIERFAELVAAAEREACLEACRMYVDLNEPPDGFQNGVECCIAVITHKDDPDVRERIKARGQE